MAGYVSMARDMSVSVMMVFVDVQGLGPSRRFPMNQRLVSH